jgi:hypothetical protein
MTDRYTIFENKSDLPIMDDVATTLNNNPWLFNSCAFLGGYSDSGSP